jgi:hypothetical protein
MFVQEDVVQYVSFFILYSFKVAHTAQLCVGAEISKCAARALFVVAAQTPESLHAACDWERSSA